MKITENILSFIFKIINDLFKIQVKNNSLISGKFFKKKKEKTWVGHSFFLFFAFISEKCMYFGEPIKHRHHNIFWHSHYSIWQLFWSFHTLNTGSNAVTSPVGLGEITAFQTNWETIFGKNFFQCVCFFIISTDNNANCSVNGHRMSSYKESVKIHH